MRVNHVRRDYYPMISGTSGGTDLTVTPGAVPVKCPWTINKIPTRLGKYFAYVPRLWMYWRFTFDQAASGGSIVYDEALYDIVHSFELRRTKMGTLFQQADTSGSRLAHVDNRFANRYRHPTQKTPSIAAADGDTVRELWIPIQFSQGCNEKPHHFAPPAALLNGALLDVYANANTAMATYSTGAVWKSATLSIIAEVLWEPEARLHVPLKQGLYEPTAQGSTQRWELELGQRKGLDGVDDTAGAALLSMVLPSSLLNLGGQLTVDEITRVQASFLSLDTQDYPQIFSVEFLNSLNRDGDYWPHSEGASVTKAHSALQLFFPLVTPPSHFELSKLSMVGGKNELVLGFSTNKANATHKVFTAEVFPWSPDFILGARDLIFGDKAEASQYIPVQKFTRKQSDEDKAVIADAKKRLLPWTFVRAAAR